MLTHVRQNRASSEQALAQLASDTARCSTKKCATALDLSTIQNGANAIATAENELNNTSVFGRVKKDVQIEAEQYVTDDSRIRTKNPPSTERRTFMRNQTSENGAKTNV